MFNNIEDNKRQLGLAERIQPSATEIYTQTNIPTGGAMPSYTQTPNVNSTKEPQYQRMGDMALRRLYAPTTENLSSYFEVIKQKHIVLVEEYITKLHGWRIDVYANKLHFPERKDFNDKLEQLYCDFATINPFVPVERYFADGADDTVAAGAFLLSLLGKRSEDNESYAVMVLSGIQWLIRERDALLDDTSLMPDEETSAASQHNTPNGDDTTRGEDEELEEVFVQLCLDDERCLVTQDGHKYKQGKVLTAIMHMYQDEKKPWADNPSRFSKELVERLPETKNLSSDDKEKKSKAWAKRINREIGDIKGLHLKDLSVENIKEKTGCIKKMAENIYNQWEGLYPIVLKCRDNIRDKQKTEEDKRH